VIEREGPRTRISTGLAFVLPTLLLGILVAAQWQTQGARLPLATRYQVTLAEAALDLQAEQERLKAQLAGLRADLDAIQSRSAGFGPRAADLERQLARWKKEAGLTAVTGEGILVTLDDARLPASAPVRTIELGIVHSTDITDVLNAAWRAGAEAISVNGERITAATACVGSVIQINGTLLSPPFTFSIVGPAERMFGALSDPGTLADQKRRRDAIGLRLRLERAAEVAVPAYTGPIAIRHATPR
jgi:uncharacterized protein YlxW (UPF0749 family)